MTCIEACQRCALDCENCLSEMMGKPSDNDCPACCRECIETCILCTQAMARQSRFADQYCGICADVCDWCAEQCGEHDHDHCQKCAESCRACAEACREMAA
jgi:hypothetical protein